MPANSAVKNPPVGSGSAKTLGQTINLKNQQVDVAKLKPEAKSRLIEILSNRYEKNTSSVHIKDNQAIDRTTSDFNELVSLIRTELNPQSMSEVGKAKLIYLLHHKVEQQDKIISLKGKPNSAGTPLSLGNAPVKSVRAGNAGALRNNKALQTPQVTKKTQSPSLQPRLNDVNPAVDYSKDIFESSVKPSPKRPAQSQTDRALGQASALNAAGLNKAKPATKSVAQQAASLKPREANTANVKTRQPIDLTEALGQDAQMPVEEVTLGQRLLNSLKQLLTSIKPADKSKAPTSALNKGPKTLPNQGMPKFNGVEAVSYTHLTLPTIYSV